MYPLPSHATEKFVCSAVRGCYMIFMITCYLYYILNIFESINKKKIVTGK